MTAPKAPLIDPKDLVPAALGLVLGFGILTFFILLAISMDMTLLVNVGDIPRQ